MISTTKSRAKKILKKASARVLLIGCVFAFMAILGILNFRLFTAEFKMIYYHNEITHFEQEREQNLDLIKKGYVGPYAELAEQADKKVSALTDERNNLKNSNDSMTAFVARRGFEITFFLLSTIILGAIVSSMVWFFKNGTFVLFFRSMLKFLSCVFFLASYALHRMTKKKCCKKILKFPKKRVG